ncbi:TIGR01777 family oxidoreductase [Paenibacillus filicis]|uniref:TIGR01777 family oxidoreductase n=1 Tax=Paenibacillus filicis TaxID=669464 RepID=A0ABU9DMU9_9BACL
MQKKVVLAGGTGFIGRYLEDKFVQLGYAVVHISRQPGHIGWSDTDGIVDALEQAELLINLAGKSVNCRYNERNKEEILKSRTETTEALGRALLACQSPPPLWINSSTATIYRYAEDRPMTEEHGELGSGFSVDVAKAWEQAFFAFDLPKTRQAALRIAIVLGPNGGVMTPYRNLVRFGLGGVQGSGKQKFSWIHVEDLYRIILFLQGQEDLSGVFNCSSPNPVTNRELMQLLRETMNRRVGLPATKWMLEIGAFLLRTETELIVKSRWVIPERLEREGFTFTFPKLEDTLQDLLEEAAVGSEARRS